jgi:hypothetical protein
MNRQRRPSLVLARTLSACDEGSSFSDWRAAYALLFAPDTQKEACERTLLSGQMYALPIIPARSGNH